jgi:hypothetical protein
VYDSDYEFKYDLHKNELGEKSSYDTHHNDLSVHFNKSLSMFLSPVPHFLLCMLVLKLLRC